MFANVRKVKKRTSFFILLQKQGSQYIIGSQNGNATYHHRTGTGPADFQCSAFYIIAKIGGDTGNDKGKRISLGHTEKAVVGVKAHEQSFVKFVARKNARHGTG